MGTAWQLIAQANRPTRVLWSDPRWLGMVLLLALLLLVGWGVVVWLQRWRKQAAPGPSSANEQLAHFRELYQKGELSQEEFERIRAALAPQLRQELGVPPRPAAPRDAGAPPG